VYGSGRDAQHPGHFIHRHSTEETHFDNSRLLWIEATQSTQRLVQRFQVRTSFRQGIDHVIQRDSTLIATLAAAFQPVACLGVVDQDPPHGRGRHGQKMSAALPLDASLIHEP
jgi:hypothetical protein